ncbi:MAG: hypothetical protein ISQ20_08760 [Alphaproteobacteria bacterium]|nr:hypothetical protein [Alphaproteobacteria bacterium]
MLFPTCPRLQALDVQLNILHRWGIADLVLSLRWAGQRYECKGIYGAFMLW